VIVILDEIDLMNDDSVLMKLSRAEEAGKIDCSVGLIAISNKIQYVDSVNERVKSSFQHKGCSSKPYDANQLREIMFNREDAFQNGVLSEDVILLSAAFAAQARTRRCSKGDRYSPTCRGSRLRGGYRTGDG